MTIVNGVTFVSERESGPWICCAPCSAAMAVGAALGQPVNLGTAHQIRMAVSFAETHRPPDGTPGGLTEDQVEQGVKTAFDLTMTKCPYDEGAFADGLRDGIGWIAQLTYSKLPTHLRRWSPNFGGGHSVYVAGVNSAGKVGWFDPLATSGWSGEWVNLGDVWPAFWTGDFDGLPRKAAGGTVVGLPLTMVAPYDGTAVVNGAGHSYIRVWDSAMIPIPAGDEKKVYARATLTNDYQTPGPSPAIPAGTPVVIIGDFEAVLLESDVTLTAAPGYVPVGTLYVKET